MTHLSILIHLLLYSLRPPPPHPPVVDHLPQQHECINLWAQGIINCTFHWLPSTPGGLDGTGRDWPLSQVVLVSPAPSTARLAIRRGRDPLKSTLQQHHQHLCLLYILATREEVISCTWHIYDAARELLGRQHSWVEKEEEEERSKSDTLVTDT